MHISGEREDAAADELRLAVHDALCRSDERAKSFEEVDYSIENFDGGKNKLVPLASFRPARRATLQEIILNCKGEGKCCRERMDFLDDSFPLIPSAPSPCTMSRYWHCCSWRLTTEILVN